MLMLHAVIHKADSKSFCSIISLVDGRNSGFEIVTHLLTSLVNIILFPCMLTSYLKPCRDRNTCENDRL